jgi:hypothetical protein
MVLAKCLKDRQGRVLENPVRYLRIGTAVAWTIALRAERDAVYRLWRRAGYWRRLSDWPGRWVGRVFWRWRWTSRRSAVSVW